MRSPLRTGLLLITAAFLAAPLAFAFDVPPNDGFVTDTTGTLTVEQEQILETKLEAYRTETSNEIAVLLVRALSGADLVESAVATGRNWGVGTKDKSNGVLMFIALEERSITIQVGYGLEGVLPDIVAKGVIDEDILPHFRDGEYAEGIDAAVDAIQKHIGGEYTAERYTAGTDGAFPFFLVFFLIVLNFLSAWFARSKTFWAGGVVGVLFGVLLMVLYGWWLALIFFIALGAGFDYWVSRFPQTRRRRRGPWDSFGGGGGFGSGGGSSGGFGGFGGGSFGGGGASGKW